MDIDKPHPTSITVFGNVDIKNETKEEKFPAEPLPNTTLHLRKREETSQNINLALALESQIKEKSTSYESSSDEVVTKEEFITQTKTGFVSYSKEKSILFVYGSKSIAGALVEFFGLPSHNEIDPSHALQSAKDEALEVSTVKILLPGSEYLTKISFQGRSLEEKAIKEYTKEEYELVSFTGKFEINDGLKLTGRFSNESMLLYIPGEETLLNHTNELVMRLLDL